MPLKLGTADVSLRMGSATPVAMYLGSAQVWSAVTAPGTPTIVSVEPDFLASALRITVTAPASDGGAAITGYTFYLDGVETSVSQPDPGVLEFLLGYTAAGDGGDFQFAAVNAIGEGPKSAAFAFAP